MDKNKYKDDYVAVLKALQHAIKYYSWDDFTRLYITKENGLEGMDVIRVKEILNFLSDEGKLTIRENISLEDYFKYPTPDHTMEHIYPGTNSNRKRLLKNRFLVQPVRIEFKKLESTLDAPEFLLSYIPGTKKYKYIKRLAEIFVLGYGSEIDNYELALCFNRKLSKSDYKNNKVTRAKYNIKIENRLKTLKKILRLHGYTVIFNQNVSELVKFGF